VLWPEKAPEVNPIPDLSFAANSGLTTKYRKEREDQAQKDAENDAGDDGKIKRRMFALDANIAGQSAQPFWREAAPHHQPDKRRGDADDHDESSQFAHHSKSCVNQTEAQA
jgi:hypothetical protein